MVQNALLTAFQFQLDPYFRSFSEIDEALNDSVALPRDCFSRLAFYGDKLSHPRKRKLTDLEALMSESERQHYNKQRKNKNKGGLKPSTSSGLTQTIDSVIKSDKASKANFLQKQKVITILDSSVSESKTINPPVVIDLISPSTSTNSTNSIQPIGTLSYNNPLIIAALKPLSIQLSRFNSNIPLPNTSDNRSLNALRTKLSFWDAMYRQYKRQVPTLHEDIVKWENRDIRDFDLKGVTLTLDYAFFHFVGSRFPFDNERSIKKMQTYGQNLVDLANSLETNQCPICLTKVEIGDQIWPLICNCKSFIHLRCFKGWVKVRTYSETENKKLDFPKLFIDCSSCAQPIALRAGAPSSAQQAVEKHVLEHQSWQNIGRELDFYNYLSPNEEKVVFEVLDGRSVRRERHFPMNHEVVDESFTANVSLQAPRNLNPHRLVRGRSVPYEFYL